MLQTSQLRAQLKEILFLAAATIQGALDQVPSTEPTPLSPRENIQENNENNENQHEEIVEGPQEFTSEEISVSLEVGFNTAFLCSHHSRRLGLG